MFGNISEFQIQFSDVSATLTNTMKQKSILKNSDMEKCLSKNINIIEYNDDSTCISKIIHIFLVN